MFWEIGVVDFCKPPAVTLEKEAKLLDLDEKRKIIRRILTLKLQGFKILNSRACLKMVYSDTWKRPSKLCYVYDKNKLFQCCRAIGNDQVCENCGYLGYPCNLL